MRDDMGLTEVHRPSAEFLMIHYLSLPMFACFFFLQDMFIVSYTGSIVLTYSFFCFFCFFCFVSAFSAFSVHDI